MGTIRVNQSLRETNKENKTLKVLKVKQGQIFTVKPLLYLLQTFPALQKLTISSITLKTLHFQAIETYISGSFSLKYLDLSATAMQTEHVAMLC